MSIAQNVAVAPIVLFTGWETSLSTRKDIWLFPCILAENFFVFKNYYKKKLKKNIYRDFYFIFAHFPIPFHYFLQLCKLTFLDLHLIMAGVSVYQLSKTLVKVCFNNYGCWPQEWKRTHVLFDAILKTRVMSHYSL